MTGCFFEAADQPWVELPITENVFSLLLAYRYPHAKSNGGCIL